MSWFAKIIAHHPYVVIVTIVVFTGTCFLIPFTTVKLPNFKDPQLGFETRGTEIARRLVAWDNLEEAIRPSGLLTVNPFLHKDRPEYFSETSKDGPVKLNQSPGGNALSSNSRYPTSNISFVIESGRNRTEDGDEDWEEEIREIDSSHHHHQHLSPDSFFCTSPNNEYGRVVMSSTDNSDLFSYGAILALCLLETGLVERPLFGELCETISPGRCCRQWSLPNYIAMINNKTSCQNITEEDVLLTKVLLKECQEYFNDFLYIAPDPKVTIPANCSKDNAAYILKHFILDYSYTKSSSPLTNVMVFLPIARSSAAIAYYDSLDPAQLSIGNIKITAIDFGIKEALFDKMLLRDVRLILLGGVFVLACIWLYTASIFLTLATMLAISFSLVIAYFFYSLVLEVKFFPFMNLLTLVVAIGVGGDASLMIHKVWLVARAEQPGAHPAKLVHSILRHLALCMLIVSITTAIAFYASYVSNITSISCFSLFAGSAVLANLLVTTLWTPACLVLSDKLITLPLPSPPPLPDLQPLLTKLVLRFRYFWILFFTLVAILSLVIILRSPSLSLPDSPSLQLFDSSHPFEQYELIYRNHFWFDRVLRTDEGMTNPNVHLPLRFVWGVLAEDSGDHLNPGSKGRLHLDPEFDLASPESQLWLLSFCTKLRAQPFYQSTMGPLLHNCFLEVFVDWMKQECTDLAGYSRAPCCQTARFPFPRKVFSSCLAKAAASLYGTSAQLSAPGYGGPKFALKTKSGLPKVKALVVEYDSNYTFTTSYQEMHRFYSQVESWSRAEMDAAPAGMRGGWFVSYLGLLDVQSSLASDTVSAVVISLVASFTLVCLATLDIFLSVCTAVTVASIIFVTVAVLLLLGWKLNVLEAIALSLTIGLAVDFAIQYVINYKLAPEGGTRETCVVFSLNTMAGPTFMAALTTAGAGLFMIPSTVLAYKQIGVFLVVVMGVSLSYSTLFLMSVLAVVGPVSSRRSVHLPELSGTELGPLRRRRAEHSPSATSATTIVEAESILHPA